jgi:hypothetical protein
MLAGIAAFFASKIMQYVAIGLLVFGVIFAVWYTGRRYERNIWIVKNNKEASRRIDEGHRSIERSEHVKRKIETSRRITPNDDRRDSCLLSEDDPAKNCAKYL